VKLAEMVRQRRARAGLYSTAEYWDSKAAHLEGAAVSMWPNNHLNALYQVAPDRPWGVDVSIAARGRQGYALPWYELLGFGGRFDGVEQQRNGIPGLTGVQVVGNDAYRLDDVHVLDAGIEKELPFRDFGLSIAIDCFNVLGTDSVLQRNHRLRVTGDASGSAPASDTVTEVVGPRAFRVGLRLRFR